MTEQEKEILEEEVNTEETVEETVEEIVEEKENGELQSTKYDKDGAIIKTRLSKNTDPCYHVREYDNNGELLIEIRMEHFE